MSTRDGVDVIILILRIMLSAAPRLVNPWAQASVWMFPATTGQERSAVWGPPLRLAQRQLRVNLMIAVKVAEEIR